MYHDYARRYSFVLGDQQKVSGRIRPVSAITVPGGANSLFFKITGVIAVTAMLLGVAGSLLFGRLIQSSLDQLAHLKGAQNELIVEQENFIAQQQHLLSREQIIAAVKAIDLYPRSESQVEYIK